MQPKWKEQQSPRGEKEEKRKQSSVSCLLAPVQVPRSLKGVLPKLDYSVGNVLSHFVYENKGDNYF